MTRQGRAGSGSAHQEARLVSNAWGNGVGAAAAEGQEEEEMHGGYRRA